MASGVYDIPQNRIETISAMPLTADLPSALGQTIHCKCRSGLTLDTQAFQFHRRLLWIASQLLLASLEADWIKPDRWNSCKSLCLESKTNVACVCVGCRCLCKFVALQ